ncbi:MAG: alkaline phosphatase family protein, partial [Pedobacter sp.]|nr:alkaline phosphatase family protein [Pedobacter sp.]
TINSGDPNFRKLAELTYTDGGKQRKVTVPKGDLLYQFRKDVGEGKLPTVSWLAGPQNFSDHPSAPWYGAWYVSEILDILTKNPSVWKKTIFIVTYDENDGYFDHVPPFSIPDLKQNDTGKVSKGIDTEIEQVRLENEIKQGIPHSQAREAPIGLGFRVPMLIASPWSRGGQVCSEVFDHTSTLQFLETFINKKFDKKIRSSNISEWRRTICGNLTSAFVPYNGSPLAAIPFLDRNKNIETIFNAKFKQEPKSFKVLSTADIAKIKINPALLSFQEKGIRSASALPYELYSHGEMGNNQKHFEISFEAGNAIFGSAAAGSPFTVQAPVPFKDQQNKVEIGKKWSFAVKAGDRLTYQWPLESFEENNYHLRVDGPNGFFREFKGNKNSPNLLLAASYEKDAKGKPTGNLVLAIENKDKVEQRITIVDNAYRSANVVRSIAANEKIQISVNLSKSFNWYDLSMKVANDQGFEQRFAGRVETGKMGKTDPYMGRMV